MTIPLKQIKKPIIKEIQFFEKYFQSVVKSNIKLLDIVNQYIIKRKGKEIRLLLTLLFAKAFGEINHKTYVAASLIQLLHTATILHDDVVDNAYIRRGFFSVNALWKSKIAVLVGDYWLSKGMLIALDNNAFDLLQIASNAVKDMSEGELLQLQKARRLDISEEVYFEIIKKKSASLISSSIMLGAKSVNIENDIIKKLYELGTYLGIAFQLKDDLLDFDTKNNTGKISFNDIKEKKLTLPIIYTLSNVNAKEKRDILNIIKNHNKNKKAVNKVVQQIIEKGGIEYTKNKMYTFHQKALQILNKLMINPTIKLSITDLIDYLIMRRK